MGNSISAKASSHERLLAFTLGINPKSHEHAHHYDFLDHDAKLHVEDKAHDAAHDWRGLLDFAGIKFAVKVGVKS